MRENDATAAEKKDGNHDSREMETGEILLIHLRRDRKELENISRDTDTMSRVSMRDVRRGRSDASHDGPRTGQSPKTSESVHWVYAVWRMELARVTKSSFRDKTNRRERGVDERSVDNPATLKRARFCEDFTWGRKARGSCGSVRGRSVPLINSTHTQTTGHAPQNPTPALNPKWLSFTG